MSRIPEVPQLMNHFPTRQYFHEPAVLGATTMGGLIAALFANIGQRVKLYDRPLSGEHPEKPTFQVIDGLLQRIPSPFSGPEASSLIVPRNYRDHWNELGEHDLVIECYGDRPGEKQGWFSRLSPGIGKDAMILSLSHGDSVAEVANALPAGIRPHFLGAHFFFPPRLQRLVELIPTERTERRLIRTVADSLQEILGAVPVVVADTPNFVANRLLVFAVNSAFAHARANDLPVGSLEMLSARLMGRKYGGLCFLLDQIGLDFYRASSERVPDGERRRYGELLVSPQVIDNFLLFSNTGREAGKGFYDYGKEPIFCDSLAEPPQTVLALLEAADWKGLCKASGKEAAFVRDYLRDLWQYMMHVSRESGFSGRQLDHILLHAFSWNSGPYALLQNFSPATVHATTRRDESAGKLGYPVSGLWSRRCRSCEGGKTLEIDPFTQQCRLLGESTFSKVLSYHDKILIWQPVEKEFGFFEPMLHELSEAIARARKMHCALMIYHHGRRFGGAKHWRRQPADLPDYAREHRLLCNVIIGLRMLPYPVMLSVSGALIDYGCAIMMQADRVIYDVDVSWRLRAIEYGLPPVGGVWFEWLRRLPHLSPELARLQIHTVLARLLGDGGINNLHAARELGIVRGHDRFAMNAAQMPKISQSVADAWLDIRQPRPLRYALRKLEQDDISYLVTRSEETALPALYRDCLALLGSENQKAVLSLRHLLHGEAQLFAYRYAAMNQEAD